MVTIPSPPPTGAIGSSGTYLWIVQNGVPQASQVFVPISIVTGVMNGATPVTVAAPQVTANSVIIPFLSVVGGTVGAAAVVETRTTGTGFTFQGTASDTSTYGFLILG